MPLSDAQTVRDVAEVEVLTLAETAAFLRSPEKAVLELAENGILPGRKIGDEWRFLKRAVVEWLRFGPHPPREFRRFPPPLMLDLPDWEELVSVLEQRILNTFPSSERQAAKPGSTQAVLRHFGVFQDDAVEEQLAGIRARRGEQAAGEF